MNRRKSGIPSLLSDSKVLTSASEKAELFSKNSNFDDSGGELPAFSRRTDITLSNMVITMKRLEEAILNFDSFKAWGPDGIPVVVLKNCEHEPSLVLTDLLNFCDCWEVLFVVPIFKNVSKRSDLKKYCPATLIPVVNKAFEKHIND